MVIRAPTAPRRRVIRQADSKPERVDSIRSSRWGSNTGYCSKGSYNAGRMPVHEGFAGVALRNGAPANSAGSTLAGRSAG
jgi:hypothetical protein